MSGWKWRLAVVCGARGTAATATPTAGFHDHGPPVSWGGRFAGPLCRWPLRRAPRPFARAFQTHAVCHVLFAHLILLFACFPPAALPRQTPYQMGCPTHNGHQAGTPRRGIARRQRPVWGAEKLVLPKNRTSIGKRASDKNWFCPRTALVLGKSASDNRFFQEPY